MVTLLGRESLLVYVAHLLLIYGDFGTFNARRAVDRSFGIVEALLSTLVLLVVMTGLAFLWSRLKARSPNLRKGVSIGFALLRTGEAGPSGSMGEAALPRSNSVSRVLWDRESGAYFGYRLEVDRKDGPRPFRVSFKPWGL